MLSELHNVFQRNAGKSVSTVRKIVNDGANNNGKFSTSGKYKTGCLRKDLDKFDLCAIRQKIQHFYTVRKQVPNLRNLLPVVREDLNFNGSREHLRKVEKAFGFKYKKNYNLKELP